MTIIFPGVIPSADNKASKQRRIYLRFDERKLDVRDKKFSQSFTLYRDACNPRSKQLREKLAAKIR